MCVASEKLREVTLQILWAVRSGVSTTEKDAVVRLLCEELKMAKKAVYGCYDRALTIHLNKELLDEQIKKVADRPLEQIYGVESAILHLALFELLIEKKISPKVVIHEAVRLARKFSYEAVGAFVNGILDAIYKKSVQNGGKEGLVSGE